jgi:hypothetical protein
MRGRVARGIEHRVDEHLAAQPERAAEQRRHGGKVRPCTVTRDADARGVGGRPIDRGHGVLDCGGTGMLGSETVVDGNDPATACDGKPAAERIVSLEVAAEEAAAVEVEEDRRRGISLGRLLPDPQDLTDDEIVHERECRRLASEGADSPVSFASLLYTQRGS